MSTWQFPASRSQTSQIIDIETCWQWKQKCNRLHYNAWASFVLWNLKSCENLKFWIQFLWLFDSELRLFLVCNDFSKSKYFLPRKTSSLGNEKKLSFFCLLNMSEISRVLIFLIIALRFTVIAFEKLLARFSIQTVFGNTICLRFTLKHFIKWQRMREEETWVFELDCQFLKYT